MRKINFDLKKNKLKNGLEVITIKKDNQIASVNLGVKVGALYETLEEKGICHFIEHMVFKGTKKRDFEELNDDLEFLGGEYNAYTDYSVTVYSYSSLEEELENTVELLSDMIVNPIFPPKEVEKERGVILAEMRSSKDDVEDYSFKRINEEAFKTSPLKYDVAGLEENVKKYSRDDLYNYYKKHYIPNNSVITIVSSMEHQDVVELVEKYFKDWEAGTVIELDIEDEPNEVKEIVTIKDNIEQSTILYLYTFYDLEKEDELPLRILNHRLGESGNSLLFREIRENRGLAYDIYSNLDLTKHLKTLYIYTAVADEDVDAAKEAIEETLEGIKNKMITFGERDLLLMKKVHKTAVVSTLDDPTELGNYILHQCLDSIDVYEFVKDMDRIKRVEVDHIYKVANKILKNPTVHILKSS